MTVQLDDHLLQQFMHTFYGYGGCREYDAPFWFVGIEEGCRGTVAGVNRRLRLWAERGKRELEDAAGWRKAGWRKAGWHLAEDPHPRFTARPTTYATWLLS